MNNNKNDFAHSDSTNTDEQNFQTNNYDGKNLIYEILKEYSSKKALTNHKVAKRVISVLTAVVLMLNVLPINIFENIGCLKLFEKSEIMTVRPADVNSSHLTTVNQLINYSKAYQYYRKEWVESNIGWVFALILAIIFVPIIVKICRKIAWEMKTL